MSLHACIMYLVSRGWTPSSAIWEPTASHWTKQSTWPRTILCGGWCVVYVWWLSEKKKMCMSAVWANLGRVRGIPHYSFSWIISQVIMTTMQAFIRCTQSVVTKWIGEVPAVTRWQHWQMLNVDTRRLCKKMFLYDAFAFSAGVLAWLSVWSKVQICMWPSWYHCHSLSRASVKSSLVLPLWYWLTWVVPEKGH